MTAFFVTSLAYAFPYFRKLRKRHCLGRHVVKMVVARGSREDCSFLRMLSPYSALATIALP